MVDFSSIKRPTCNHIGEVIFSFLQFQRNIGMLFVSTHLKFYVHICKAIIQTKESKIKSKEKQRFHVFFSHGMTVIQLSI